MLVSTQVLVSSAWRFTHSASTDTAAMIVARIRMMIGRVRRFLTGASALGVWVVIRDLLFGVWVWLFSLVFCVPRVGKVI